MAKEKEERDLEKFLKNVDEISTLVQDLNSDDFDVCERAMDEAEKRLQFQEDQEEDECRTTLNKTMISPPQVPTEVDVDDSNPDAFMKIIEKDARERAKRRKENKSLANAFKEKGNEAFLKGDYEMAVHYYTEGLKKLKDMKVLYTNRAQAYMKLEEYEKALVDCEWALKVQYSVSIRRNIRGNRKLQGHNLLMKTQKQTTQTTASDPPTRGYFYHSP